LAIAGASSLPFRARGFDLGHGTALDVVAALAIGFGLPFVAVSATSPLLQSWFARTGKDPYPLASASNLGSLAGLLAYPVLVEPLALYLITVAHAFDDRSRVPAWIWKWLLPIVVANAAVLQVLGVGSFGALLSTHLAVLFVAAGACHKALAADRPGPASLTGY